MKRLFVICVAVLLVGTAGAQQSVQKENKTYSLTFDASKCTKAKSVLNGKTIAYRCYKNVVYCSRPVDANYECMNIFVPEAYFNDKSIDRYTKETAPVFLPNNVGGYMPATPGEINPSGRPQGIPGMKFPGMPPKMNNAKMPPRNFVEGMPARPNTILEALAKGYVVASPGARGRSLQTADSIYYGKAPAFIVDMKAAVRYLRHNDKLMPGNAERIISNGTSAGGALSALLGASGDSQDYAGYLKAIGAADEKDDIFAVSAYCPITNLDHADAAYEWLFNGVNQFKKMAFGNMVDFRVKREEVDATLSESEIAVSNQLKKLFPAYVNSLQLKDKAGNLLTLDEQGNGSFKNYVMSFVMASAQKALNAGTDLSKISWLTISKGKVTNMDFNLYVKTIMRMKTPPAFDKLDLSSAETIEFGTEKTNAQHFTSFGMEHSSVKATMADVGIIKMMNPMNYIGVSSATPAKHWRIRHGTIDRDGSIAVPVILATKLMDCGYDVDVFLPWNTPHSGDYDLEELFAWIDGLCKVK
jgi:hypothetical protein